MTTATILATLLNDDDGWYERGQCVQDGADSFFARPDELGDGQREAQAKQWCANCPVLAECLQWALSAGDLPGVWAGGTSTADRLAAHRSYEIAS